MNFFKKYGLKILIWLILLASVWALSYRFFHIKKHFDASILLNVRHYWLVMLVWLLMSVNWIIEAIKWQLATKHLQNISIWDSLKGVLMGVSVSLIMPNRTGEFVGKILVLERDNRVRGVLASMLTSISQLLMTLIFGVMGMFLFQMKEITLTGNYLFISGVLLLALTLFYFIFPTLFRRLIHFLPDKFVNFLSFLKNYRFSDLMLLIFWSFVRYIVFVFQLYLLFVFFGMSLNVFDFCLNASVSFLLTTIIPTTSFTELFVRNQVGLMLFENMVIHDEVIVASFSALWIINIAIPALIGIIIGVGYKN